MTYEAIASIFRQCEKSNTYDNTNITNGETLSTNVISTGGGWKRYSGGGYRVRKLTIEQLRAKKHYNSCRACKKYRHWDSDHNLDRSIKYGLPSNDRPPQTAQSTNESGTPGNQFPQPESANIGKNKNVFNFGMVNLLKLDNLNTLNPRNANSFANHLGLLVDGGAPYSAIRRTELCVLRCTVGLSHIKNL